jgi:hypothetical protein
VILKEDMKVEAVVLELKAPRRKHSGRTKDNDIASRNNQRHLTGIVERRDLSKYLVTIWYER